MRVHGFTILLAAVAGAALGGCRTSPQRTEVYGLLDFGSLDFSHCRSLERSSRPAEIPDASIVAGYGSLTGIAFRAGTDSGADSVSIILSPLFNMARQLYRDRLTGPTGGFAFDSLAPGRYRVLVRGLRVYPESSFVVIDSNRIDTVRVPVRATANCATSVLPRRP